MVASAFALKNHDAERAAKRAELEQQDIENEIKQNSTIEVLPTMNSESTSANRIWVGTCQIVWNDVMDTIEKNPIEFIEGENKTASDLNKREFNKEKGKEQIISTEIPFEVNKALLVQRIDALRIDKNTFVAII